MNEYDNPRQTPEEFMKDTDRIKFLGKYDSPDEYFLSKNDIIRDVYRSLEMVSKQ